MSEISLADATPEVGHNSGNKLLAFLNNVVDDLGIQSARGTTALSDLAMRVVEAAHAGVLQPEAAKTIYERYASAAKNAGGTHGSVKTNTSKIKKLIELGCLPDGLRIAEDTILIRDGIKEPKSAFEALVDVARLRLKEKRKLTGEEITTASSKAPRKAKAKDAPKQDEDGAIEGVLGIIDRLDSYIGGRREDIAEYGPISDTAIFIACQACENLQSIESFQVPEAERERAIIRLGASARVLLELLSKLIGASEETIRAQLTYIAENGAEITTEKSA